MVKSKSPVISFIGYIYLRVLQMDSNIPKDILVRWKTYGFERYSWRRRIWGRLLSGQSHKTAVAEEVDATMCMMRVIIGDGERVSSCLR